MNDILHGRNRHAHLPVVTIYVLFGSLWIFVSGRLLAANLVHLEMAEDFFFILLTASLLYLLLNRYIRQLAVSEQSLQESEERFRSIFEQAAVGVALVESCSGKFLRINKKYCDITGYSAEEMLGKSFQDITHPDDRQTDLDNVRRLQAGTIKTYIREKRYLHRNGSVVWVNLTVSPQWLQGEEPTCQIVIVEDITERKEAEAALRKSDDRLSLALAASRMGVWEWNVRTGGITRSPECFGIFGVESCSCTLESFTTALHPDDTDRVMAAANQALAQKTGYQTEYRIVRPDGQLRWLSDQARPTYDDQGNPLRLIGTVQDITERKNAEIALCESKELLQAVINGTDDLIFIKDRDSRTLLANPAFLRIMGIPPEEVIGKNARELHPDPKIADSILKNDRRIMETGQAEVIEETVHSPAGRRIFLSNKIPRRDASGRVIGLIGVSHDITALKQAEQDRLALEQQFQQTQKLESLGLLAGGIAHDFNNILTIILGHCFILKEQIGSNGIYTGYVQQIETAASRAADLCRQMLTYAGRNPLLKGEVDLWLMVDETVKMLRSGIKKNVSFELDLKRRVPAITGDKAQMQQIVMNLVINAAEAIADKNGTVRIGLGMTEIVAGQADSDFLGNAIRSGKYSRLEVSDTGCGMTEETRKRIFEPFFTTKITGRGLGMSSVLGIIKSHAGAVQFSSKPGSGTTFTVYFPLAEASDPAEAGLEEPSIHSLKPRGTILLVDDEETLCTLGAALLSAMGFSAVTALNGREALKIYRQRGASIDLVLMDLVMPEVGGVETYRELRKMDPTVPVVICSGYSIDEVAQITNNDEQTGFLQKPYTQDQLRSVVTKLLDKTG